jgi:DNA-directed RNA polymerase subunit alpha
MMEMKRPKITYEENEAKNCAKFVVEPLERGFGATLGNSLRRILLSALPGAAPVGIQIAGVEHEFSTIKGVREDVTEIILNIKGLAVKIYAGADRPTRKEINLYKNTAGAVTAGDIDIPSDVEILNPDMYICTLEEGAVLDMRIFVDVGRGYVAASANKDSRSPIGFIPVDSIYTPVEKASYFVESTRVEQSLDFDKLTIEVQTNGTISAKEITS